MKTIDSSHSTPKRIVYVGDLHGSRIFEKFVDTFPADTHFSLVGDLFDRNPYSAEVYLTIKRLHKEGRLSLSIGNHDLFFLLGFGLRDESKSRFAERARSVLSESARNQLCATFSDQFYTNGGESTIFSFAQELGPDIATTTDEVIDFLSQFGLYNIDIAGNITAHGTVACILPDGSPVGETIGGRFVSGFDYVKELDSGLRSLDFNTLLRLTAREKILGSQIYEDMEKNGAIRDPELLRGNRDYVTDMIPTWYCNRLVVDERCPEVVKTLRSELDRSGFKRMICGHWMNDNPNFGQEGDPEMERYGNTILCLDRSYIGLDNFGFAVIDVETNEVLEIGDSWHFLHRQKQD